MVNETFLKQTYEITLLERERNNGTLLKETPSVILCKDFCRHTKIIIVVTDLIEGIMTTQ